MRPLGAKSNDAFGSVIDRDSRQGLSRRWPKVCWDSGFPKRL